MKIYKYRLETKITRLELPTGSVPLHTHEQAGGICVWVSLTDSKVTKEYIFEVVATGEDYGYGDGKYIGTAHLENGLVFHIFYY